MSLEAYAESTMLHGITKIKPHYRRMLMDKDSIIEGRINETRVFGPP